MDEIVAEFLVESYESLDRLDRDLLALERDPHSREVLASIFRTMHTIKGTCGFLGFAKLERIAHAAESLLAGLRDGSLSITPQTAGVLLATGDVMRLILRQIEATGTDGEDDHDGLVEDLGRLRGAPPGVSPAVPPAPGAQPEPQPVRSGPDRSVGLRSAVTETTVRVDVNVLDRLMTLVGELVLARNQLAALASDRADPSLASATQSVDRITAELQEGVTKTRLQPIRTAWATLPRVARDLAVALDKRVRIETDGDDTELDRSIIEAIKDPLTHIVRNAVDHGIEGPEARVAAGKAEEGAVIVRAYHEGGQVTIEVADDGAGIDLNAVRTKAVELASVTPEQAKRMSEREALDLLFLPGLSTADEVTTVSGRGVGMDVVRTNIERIGGSIDLSSRRGEGTIFKIRIPLTLAIIPVLIVTSRDERFAIPQANLLELVGVVPGSIEILHEVPVYRLRDRLLPVVSLARELHLGGDDEESPAGRFLVVLQADDRRFGLLVDGLSDPSEIVVKPLGAQLHGLEVFAGATILGTGRVGLILDVVGLAARAGVVGDVHEPLDAERPGEVLEDARALLVFADAAGGRMAVPLDLVDRLEEFPRAAIERSGLHEAVPYGDRILPLVPLHELIVDRRRAPRHAGEDMPAELQVLVHRRGEDLLGLVVGRIIDIVEQPAELQPAGRPGVTGTMFVQGRITEILDLPGLLEMREERRRLDVSASAGAAS
ncbi:MAG: chemotaxis protein CheA [Actinobacteria bacterium]|nr:MAG: chemotaxis protein CheA [Actinomycetota bacterium]TMK93250.1 MAG: chemotaxis protein CheA [Actinomycetota bacterium]